jgi:predicted acyl esterase
MNASTPGRVAQRRFDLQSSITRVTVARKIPGEEETMRLTLRRASLWGVMLMLLAASDLRAQPFQLGAGTEGRQWLPERVRTLNPVQRFPVTIQDDVAITVRDGTKLDARLFLPTLATGAAPTPCVLLSDGYGRGSVTGASFDGTLFDIAARGYAVLHLSLRGSGKSGGTADLYNQFGRDGYDTVEWMAKQPWCNGSVGMVGPSLLGISQWLTAKEAPPSLKAIVPQVACGDCYGLLWFPDGMLPGPGREARKLSPGAEAEYTTATQHRNLDAWWRERTTLAEDHAAIAARGVAAFISGGLEDYISPANIRAYEQFNAPGARKRLLLAPHAHGWQIDYLQELQVQWLDHWLKGVDNGVETAPRVILFVKGANRWRYEADWPIADAKPVRLYMQPGKSRSIASLNDGGLASRPGGAGEAAVLPYTPGAGPSLPVLLSATLGRPAGDQRPDEEKVLTWTTAPLPVATEVTGYPHVSLWAASSAADGDMVFSLNDVAPDGVSTQIVQGYLNGPHAASLSDPRPLIPGQAQRFELDLLPTAYVLQPGHRIRLALAGAARAVPGMPFPQGPGASPAAFTWTVLQDAEHPATLELPVVGTGGEQLAQLTITQR